MTKLVRFLGYSAFSLVLVHASVAAAGLKSGKIKSTVTNPANVASTFTNGTSKGSFDFKGTKFKIQAKGLSTPNTDGIHCSADDVICVVNIHVGIAGNTSDVTAVIHGEVADGKLTASHDFCKDRDSGIDPASDPFCPDVFGQAGPISLSQIGATCYAYDAAWIAANPIDMDLGLTGHGCEGLLFGTPTTPTTVLFTNGTSLIVP